MVLESHIYETIDEKVIVYIEENDFLRRDLFSPHVSMIDSDTGGQGIETHAQTLKGSDTEKKIDRGRQKKHTYTRREK